MASWAIAMQKPLVGKEPMRTVYPEASAAASGQAPVVPVVPGQTLRLACHLRLRQRGAVIAEHTSMGSAEIYELLDLNLTTGHGTILFGPHQICPCSHLLFQSLQHVAPVSLRWPTLAAPWPNTWSCKNHKCASCTLLLRTMPVELFLVTAHVHKNNVTRHNTNWKELVVQTILVCLLFNLQSSSWGSTHHTKWQVLRSLKVVVTELVVPVIDLKCNITKSKLHHPKRWAPNGRRPRDPIPTAGRLLWSC